MKPVLEFFVEDTKDAGEQLYDLMCSISNHSYEEVGQHCTEVSMHVRIFNEIFNKIKNVRMTGEPFNEKSPLRIGTFRIGLHQASKEPFTIIMTTVGANPKGNGFFHEERFMQGIKISGLVQTLKEAKNG